jgi:hypothetical protein
VSADDVVAIEANSKGLDECVYIDCHYPPKNGIRGEHCVGHAKALENAFKGVEEPALEARLKRVRTPPPSVEYEPDPDYVFPQDPAPQPEPSVRGVAGGRGATSRQWHPAVQIAPQSDDTLEYLSDALEGHLGAIKAAQAQVLVQLAADALRAL